MALEVQTKIARQARDTHLIVYGHKHKDGEAPQCSSTVHLVMGKGIRKAYFEFLDPTLVGERMPR
jgi:hypothetical protein